MAEALATQRFETTADFKRLDEPDAILICVPTPLTRNREPDLSYIVQTGHVIAERLRPGQLVVLESTTYPGTTDEVLRPLLEAMVSEAAGTSFSLIPLSVRTPATQISPLQASRRSLVVTATMPFSRRDALPATGCADSTRFDASRCRSCEVD